ncbi:MAG: HAMP domain-containing histidine kinase, partial [Clostridia bacterium]|nr:HAMP domain-containing histidine kinase [Clostridia bacterium]
MRLLFRYLKSRLCVIVLFIAFVLIFAAVFALYRLPLEAVLYPAGLCLMLGAGCAAAGFLRLRKRCEILEDLKRLEPGLPERLPMPPDVETAQYQEIIRLLWDIRTEELARAGADHQAMTDYYTLWAHQIKTPIAAMRLKLQGQDNAEARSLLTDLGRIERYVEMVLTYLRLEGNGTDYVIRECDLDTLLRSVFKQFS